MNIHFNININYNINISITLSQTQCETEQLQRMSSKSFPIWINTKSNFRFNLLTYS